MIRRKRTPMTYVVRWGNVWKAGFATSAQRPRSFELRGAEVINVTHYESGLDALGAERLLENWLSHLGHPAFSCKADAIPYLGCQGAGYTECYCLCGSQDGSFCESQSGTYVGLPRRTPTYGTYGTDGESGYERANLSGRTARASRELDLSSEVAVEKWAASITGCTLVDWYCATHDLSWVMCRWMEIAGTVYRARREGRLEGIQLAARRAAR